MARRPNDISQSGPQRLAELVRSTVPPVHPAGIPFIAAGAVVAALGRNHRWVRRAGLAAVVKARRVTDLVLGYPYNMDGTTGFKAKEVDAFADQLRADLGLPVHLIDERLTSHMAEAGMTQLELREIRAKGIVDSRAAALILQDFLDQRFPPPPPAEELP